MAEDPVRENTSSKIQYDDVPLAAGALWQDGPEHQVSLQSTSVSPAYLGTVAYICARLWHDQFDLVAFGPCSGGTIFEIELPERPQISFLDGHIIVDLPRNTGHLHLAVAPSRTASPDRRRCSRLAFFAGYGQGDTGVSALGMRLWNTHGQQMLTFFYDLAPTKRTRAVESWLQLRSAVCNLSANGEPRISLDGKR